MIRRSLYALVLVWGLGLGTACAGGGQPAPEVAAGGPPVVRAEVIERHAAQFDRGELRSRPAGSQQELSAATYILGHLQRAGYAVRLEGVPVKDLVSSTDVIALPPSGGSPSEVVTVAYDTEVDARGFGADIGLFLELARALRVVDPRHEVMFAALGAENTRIGGGGLGSRRLIRLLDEGRADPAVIAITNVGPGPVCIEDRATPGCEAGPPAGPYAEAGLERTPASGPPEALGRALLDLLGDPGA